MPHCNERCRFLFLQLNRRVQRDCFLSVTSQNSCTSRSEPQIHTSLLLKQTPTLWWQSKGLPNKYCSIKINLRRSLMILFATTTECFKSAQNSPIYYRMLHCKLTLSWKKHRRERARRVCWRSGRGGGEGVHTKRKKSPSSAPSELGFPSKYENSFTQRGNRCPWLEFACGFILF